MAGLGEGGGVLEELSLGDKALRVRPENRASLSGLHGGHVPPAAGTPTGLLARPGEQPAGQCPGGVWGGCPP